MEGTEENTHFAQVQDNVGKYLRSGRVDVKGLSFNLGYTRQWLCLTKDGRLLFFKDSVSVNEFFGEIKVEMDSVN